MKFSIFASRAFSPNTSSRDLMREEIEPLTAGELRGKVNALEAEGYQINAILDTNIVERIEKEQRERSAKRTRC